MHVKLNTTRQLKLTINQILEIINRTDVLDYLASKLIKTLNQLSLTD
jgi:hypothetical protein